MLSSFTEHLNIHHVTHNQPFCAGVILLQHNCLLTTLNTDGLPPAMAANQAWRVGGVGGGQEPGETIWECAQREAREELSTTVELISAPTTYFHDIDSGEIRPIHCTDTIAPFLLQRQSNLYPYTSYRPGLPAGPYTYFGLFLAQLPPVAIQPGDDVAGLLFVPLDAWSLLQQQPPLESLLQEGARLVEKERLPRSRQLWLHPHESMSTVVHLLTQRR